MNHFEKKFENHFQIKMKLQKFFKNPRQYISDNNINLRDIYIYIVKEVSKKLSDEREEDHPDLSSDQMKELKNMGDKPVNTSLLSIADEIDDFFYYFFPLMKKLDFKLLYKLYNKSKTYEEALFWFLYLFEMKYVEYMDFPFLFFEQVYNKDKDLIDKHLNYFKDVKFIKSILKRNSTKYNENILKSLKNSIESYKDFMYDESCTLDEDFYKDRSY